MIGSNWQMVARGLQLRRTRGALSRMRHVAAWWWVLFGWILLSGFLRAEADNFGPPTRTIGWEDNVFGVLPSVWLQQNVYPLWEDGIRWAAVIVHGSWFVVPWFMIPLVVTVTRPERLGSLVRWMIGLNLASLAVFALLPVRPPWMADSQVVRILELEVGPIRDSNPYSAFPSMHVALSCIIAFWLLNERRRILGSVMLAYTAIVGLEVVMSGEHYVADVTAAVVVASIVATAIRFDVLARIRSISSLAFKRPVRGTGRLEPALERATAAGGGEGGQALIELALVLPLIMLFLLTLVDFGIAIDHRQVLQHAVRDGVRFGTVGNSVADVQTHTADQAIDLITVSDVDVCYIDENQNGNPGNAGDSINVTAHYTYQFSIGGEILAALIGEDKVPSIEMDPSATLRLESSVTGATACP